MPTLTPIIVIMIAVTMAVMNNAMAITREKHTTDSSPEASALRHAGAVLSIDLGALQKNWQTYKKAVSKSKNCAVGAVIKAGGYGLEARHVGVALGVVGCKTFFVATIDEGIELRSVIGPDAEIFILGCAIGGNETDLAQYALSPVLNSMEDISVWKKFSSTSANMVAAALHIDTGINRLGLGAGDVKTIAKNPDIISGVNLSLVMSHLACADEQANPMNETQLASFKDAISSINGLVGVRASIANSSGVFLGGQYHLDLVRPGVALYGVNPTPDKANPMDQVVRLQGKILQVRKIDTPDSVGYGATHKAAGPERIATVAAGYADGILRSLSNNGVAYVGKYPAPYVGRVSMDLITINVSAIPEKIAHAGALVDLIGPSNTVDDMAARSGTIGYEILTNLGSRYGRVYVGGAKI